MSSHDQTKTHKINDILLNAACRNGVEGNWSAALGKNEHYQANKLNVMFGFDVSKVTFRVSYVNRNDMDN